MMHGNSATVIFKCNNIPFKIKALCNALQFVAMMEQLRRAIATGAKQNCYHLLTDKQDREWILECRCVNGIVALEIWFQGFGFHEQMETMFSWDGIVAEFDNAVCRLTAILEIQCKKRREEGESM
nr:hypothetical protein [Pedobacter panaciterrae]